MEGTVKVNGRLSYTSQEPWLFSASLRDNILFGNPYDPDRYQTVIEGCALIKVHLTVCNTCKIYVYIVATLLNSALFLRC